MVTCCAYDQDFHDGVLGGRSELKCFGLIS